MSLTNLQAIHSAVSAVCPIHGVSIVSVEDKQTWSVHFKGEATVQQKAAAQSVIDSFDATSLNEPPHPVTADDFEAVCQNALGGGDSRIDMRRLLKAKFISDLAWRLGKAPGSLTAQELLAERNRIAAIYKNL